MVVKINVIVFEVVEEIDIGGVILICVVVKNYFCVIIFSDFRDYVEFFREIEVGEVKEEIRKFYVFKVFEYIVDYDVVIFEFFCKQYVIGFQYFFFCYGVNFYQKFVFVYVKEGEFFFKVFGGVFGYINFFDVFNSWFLVKEFKKVFGKFVVVSFKYVFFVGVVIGEFLIVEECKVYMVDDIFGIESFGFVQVYVCVRGVDCMSSFGDMIVFFDIVDVFIVSIIFKEVFDGVIVFGYEFVVFEIFKKKKGGKYFVFQMDFEFEFFKFEIRIVYGIIFVQGCNDVEILFEIFCNIIIFKNVGFFFEIVQCDLIVVIIVFKYIQSNFVCYVVRGQVVGFGVGQQFRIYCICFVGDKVDNWWFCFYFCVLGIKWKKGIKCFDKSNVIDLFVSGQVFKFGFECEVFEGFFEEVFVVFIEEEKIEWFGKFIDVVVFSDVFVGFFFVLNI